MLPVGHSPWTLRSIQNTKRSYFVLLLHIFCVGMFLLLPPNNNMPQPPKPQHHLSCSRLLPVKRILVSDYDTFQRYMGRSDNNFVTAVSNSQSILDDDTGSTGDNDDDDQRTAAFRYNRNNNSCGIPAWPQSQNRNKTWTSSISFRTAICQWLSSSKKKSWNRTMKCIRLLHHAPTVQRNSVLVPWQQQELRDLVWKRCASEKHFTKQVERP